jgi:glycosyltransferase involved in cell wall biosynthesis
VTLLEALARLHDELDWPLYVVGARGWKESPVFRAVQELGLERRVVFVGYAPPEELRYWYSAATLFVYPSLYEGFGLPVLEAMACGTPVITANRSALPEVAGEAAVLVDPTDASALAGAIAALAADERRRAFLARAGLARARAFTWERTARATAEAYRAVARQTVEERGGAER